MLSCTKCYSAADFFWPVLTPAVSTILPASSEASAPYPWRWFTLRPSCCTSWETRCPSHSDCGRGLSCWAAAWLLSCARGSLWRHGSEVNEYREHIIILAFGNLEVVQASTSHHHLVPGTERFFFLSGEGYSFLMNRKKNVRNRYENS